MRSPDDPQRGANTDRGQRAGIAMVEKGHLLRQDGQRMCRNRLIHRDILALHHPRLIQQVRGIRPGPPQQRHPIQRPEQVHRRRPRCAQNPIRRLQRRDHRHIRRLGQQGRLRHAEPRRHPDGRGTPHRHVADGARHRLGRGQVTVLHRSRQEPLIQKPQAMACLDPFHGSKRHGIPLRRKAGALHRKAPCRQSADD